MINKVIYSLLVLIEKLFFFQQTVVTVYYVLKFLIFLDMENDG